MSYTLCLELTDEENRTV